uniref:Uncharacterized protein n=1 Tax=viral metagenome TaxID=1070528 RepID=A0A6M3KUN4_9ZZZZ
MQIKFTRDCELEIVEWFNEDWNEQQITVETFTPGEMVDVNIFAESEDGQSVDIQFFDGGSVFGLPKDCFKIIE